MPDHMRRIAGVGKTLSGVSLAYSKVTYFVNFFLLLCYILWPLN